MYNSPRVYLYDLGIEANLWTSPTSHYVVYSMLHGSSICLIIPVTDGCGWMWLFYVQILQNTLEFSSNPLVKQTLHIGYNFHS